MRALLQWLEERTGYRNALDDALYERIPSGSRWRYVFGSTLVFAFVTQMITGLFLWMAYSPSSQTAWESVYYIQYEMQGGWWLRGVHHFMAQAMVVLLALHLVQVIWDGAYRAPREVNFWLGLVLMQIVLGLSLTGYLLPWDQKGYWATSVATNLATLVPFVGKHIQTLVVGGPQYGHHTLTRFFALHAGVLPVLLVGTLTLHLALFRKHGVNAVISRGRADAYFWPDQVLKDAVACLAVLVVVFLLAIHFDVGGVLNGGLNSETAAHKYGAELGAPADPSEQYSAARPEWYFLFLFQLLKYFPGHLEIVGAIILPGLAMFLLFIMPFTAKIHVGKRQVGHVFNVIFIFAMVIGAGALTGVAIYEDYYGSGAKDYLPAVAEAHASKERMIELIQHREEPDGPPGLVPRTGAISLLRGDPATQGPKLFERNCLGCHAHTALDDELAESEPKYWEEREISAPNLDGFAGHLWIEGMLDPTRIRSLDYFGNTAHRCGRMAEWVRDFVPSVKISTADLANDEKLQSYVRRLKLGEQSGAGAKLREMAEEVRKSRERQVIPYADGQLAAAPPRWLPACDGKPIPAVEEDGESAIDTVLFAYLGPTVDDVAAALSAQAKLPAQSEFDKQAVADGKVARGIKIIQSTCTKGCHSFGDAGQLGLAPDLTGYGSWEWMMGMVSDPAHRRFYGRENDRMPAYGKSLDDPQSNQLTAHQISMIVDWLRGEYVGASEDYVGKPHTQQQATRAWEFARITEAPVVEIVGVPVREASPQLARAEKIFREHCAACHSHADEHGVGIVAKNPSAPNLYGFASREWIEGLLDPEKFNTPQYFGKTAHAYGEMSDTIDGLDADDVPSIAAALKAEAALPGQTDDLDREARKETLIGAGCLECHTFHGGDYESAPDLTGYGSREWIVQFVADPAGHRFYGRTTNDRMPAFARHTGGRRNLLTKEEMELLARYIRGEDLSSP